MDGMNRKIGMIYSLLLLVLCSCSNDLDSLHGGAAAKGIPVQFTAECPQDGFPYTRAGSGLKDKMVFEANDVIHVTATFYSDKEAKDSLTTKYVTLKLNKDNEWVNENELLEMNWPWNSGCARFKAYYLAEWDAALDGSTLRPTEVVVADKMVVLDRFFSDEGDVNPDPLEAETDIVEYGHAVNLQFKHLCTRLTIVGVDDADEYWLKYNSEANPLPNACVLKRNTDNTLSFDFETEKSGKVAAPVFDIEEDGKSHKAVTFHLKPGNYETFVLTRRNNAAYITISNVEELNGLLPNTPYEVFIEDLQGNITPDDDDDDWWDGEVDPMPEHGNFNVKEFMEAIRDSKQYACKLGTEDVVLLEKSPNRNEVTLKRDVDFKGETCPSVVLEALSSFDGGENTISGVAHTLFSQLSGKVSRLNLKAETVTNKVESGSLQTKWGILAGECSGVVEDVNLMDGTLEVEVKKAELYEVGLLIGSVKSGSTLSGITLGGNLSVSISPAAGLEGAAYEVNVGGMIGQCGGVLDGFSVAGTVTVKNACTGYGNRYTGGVAGVVAGGTVRTGKVSATVDAGAAIGSWNYTGGVTGTVRDNVGSHTTATLAGVTASGSVTGGAIHVLEGGDNPHSATGGIVGHVQQSSVTGCAASNLVSIGQYEESASGKGHEYYSIGGCIGSIVSNQPISNNSRHTSFNATQFNGYGDHYHAGRFAGIGNEAALKEAGNTATEDSGLFVGHDK